MTKKIEIEQKEGESLPLAPERKRSSATPSSGGHPRNAPVNSAEIDAPYELPDGWKWCRLGDCATVISKGTTPKGGKDAYLQEGINFLKIENLNDDGTINLENIAHISKTLHETALKRSMLEENDLLISIAGTLGKVGFVRKGDLPLNTNQAIAFVRLKKNIFKNMYLKYAIESPFINAQLLAQTKVTSIPNLTLEIISNCTFPLPPTLAEQQRIVNRIESMFAKLNEAKEKAQSVVEGFETRKAAILHKAFTGELTAKWRKENRVSDDSWGEKKIGEICKLGSGGTPSKSNQEYYSNGTIPWLKTGEIDWNDIFEIEEKITEAGVKNSSAKLYPVESVVVAMYGMGATRGKAGILKIPATTNQAVCVLQPDESLFNRFLFYYFMCNYWQFREKAVGGNQLNYSATMISKWMINMPSIPEQQEIVRILDTLLEKERTAKEAAEKVLEQIDLLKKSILARAFRGEL